MNIYFYVVGVLMGLINATILNMYSGITSLLVMSGLVIIDLWMYFLLEKISELKGVCN